MEPIGPLMWEHRLIERMIRLMEAQREKIHSEGKADPVFIETAVDFFRTYADRCHHGKEEDILFKALEKKNVKEEHRRIVNELIEDHKFGRKTVKELLEANARYRQGNVEAREDIRALLGVLKDFYPQHIIKEDKHFFFPCMDYFSKSERETMLADFYEFDRKMIHEKYEKTVLSWEGR